jgi:glycosyltransferase involved in cell wall biosynthesis
MKVLYVGVYRDPTGWGQAARDYILALDAAGVDVVPRPLKLDPHQAKLPDRIRELEAGSSRGCDVVVQHVLPHQMDYNGRMLNVGLYATETSDFKSSAWAERVNAMDRAVVINRQSKAASEASGVTVPVSVVPHACDVTRYQKSYDCPDLLKPHKDRGEFLFYTVGEFTPRKNLVALLKAFHLEFDPDEPVGLVIKASRPGLSPAECRRAVEGLCEEVKRGLKLHGGPEHYKQEVVITDRVTDHVMLRIHAGCDCFVQPSRGEAWSIPAFDAMAMGRTPIVTACTGYLDYLSDNEGWLVRSPGAGVRGDGHVRGFVLRVGDVVGGRHPPPPAVHEAGVRGQQTEGGQGRQRNRAGLRLLLRGCRCPVKGRPAIR